MKNLLKDRFEFIVGIITLTLVSVNRKVFGEFTIVRAALEVAFCLLVYDVVKLFILKIPVIGPKWLVSMDGQFPYTSIHSIESAVSENARIFIMTPNLFADTQVLNTKRTVSRNLKRGVRYVFLTLDIPEMIRIIEDLLSIHNNSELITVYGAKKIVIDSMAADNIMIINEPGQIPKGYLQIPDGSGEFWAIMSTKASEGYFLNIKNVVQNSSDELDKDDVSNAICRLIAGKRIAFLR